MDTIQDSGLPDEGGPEFEKLPEDGLPERWQRRISLPGRGGGKSRQNFFNAIVVLSIVTTLPVPNLVRWLIEHYHLSFAGTTEEVYEFKEDQDELV